MRPVRVISPSGRRSAGRVGRGPGRREPPRFDRPYARDREGFPRWPGPRPTRPEEGCPEGLIARTRRISPSLVRRAGAGCGPRSSDRHGQQQRRGQWELIAKGSAVAGSERDEVCPLSNGTGHLRLPGGCRIVTGSRCVIHRLVRRDREANPWSF